MDNVSVTLFERAAAAIDESRRLIADQQKLKSEMVLNYHGRLNLACRYRKNLSTIDDLLAKIKA